MSRLTELLRHAKAANPDLGAALEQEIRELSDRRAFGLNFERHRPEGVECPNRPVRRGDKVRILPSRGELPRGDQRLWTVTRIHREGSSRIAHLTEHNVNRAPETTERSIDDLVVVADFQDSIYPGLLRTGGVSRGGEKPAHTVINGENYHVLRALTYTHHGKVDAIYIDPPYNTGAKDWKYNNDYVDGEDLYRHSKWLAFMERRLLIARELLNPSSSTLIVTIDEKEVHRLGLLLEQTFPDATIQMVTITINHRGVARNREFTRVEEYAYFVFIGDAGPCLTDDDLLSAETEEPSARQSKVRWEWLIKGSNNAQRQDRPNLFYPVYVDPERKCIAKVGDAIPLDVDRQSIPDEPGLVAVWPLGRDGKEKRWQVSPDTLRGHVAAGRAKAGAYDRKNDRWSILYLNRGQLERIDRGEIRVLGKDENGVLELELASQPARAGMTIWNRGKHSAGYYGSGVVRALIPDRKFPYPKSLYAVEDALRFAVKDNPDAVVLDFFAGSGTSAHALMRLNHQDGGRRQCILVTNNEVDAAEHQKLRLQGHRPGDPEWERWGICDYITKPRIAAAITGTTPDGDPIKGNYKFVDEFPMADGFSENAEFFTLTYESPLTVSHNKAFERIAPLLWLRAGSRGPRIDAISPQGWSVTDAYGVLVDLDQAAEFCVKLPPSAAVAYIVTNDERRFQSVARGLPGGVEPVRLYESYLTNFRFANGD
ncbi:site-specific DNA-methyltransferase [Rhodococcus hoagii]|nr:site-specific DNA-methyltransferase [Prescottella equi]MBM4570182.1 site-specific DNA-methyltransferase [Prescottella equi]MBM4574922.1 site-specific DNA-methyltransferase [Prescottella equi]MBM4654142.1 site-specific DNA-methyltransferase [Prescottella equi]MBM4719615.1 site-specific DNA-methyltransferase [Prescottella equi]